MNKYKVTLKDAFGEMPAPHVYASNCHIAYSTANKRGRNESRTSRYYGFINGEDGIINNIKS